MSNVFFISGHRVITDEEFTEHYIPKIDKAIGDGASFVVGDYEGADIMSQEYLHDLGVDDVTVYHMFVAPRNNAGFKTQGGYTGDVERDWAMTLASDFDIAWVREGKETSGTAQNMFRRNIKIRGVIDIAEMRRYEKETFGL